VIDYIHENKHEFKIICINAEDWQNRPDIRITLDTPEDYKRIIEICHYVNNYEKTLRLEEIIRVYDTLFSGGSS